MPNFNAARIVARDLRKHKEERRNKVKTNEARYDNQCEYLKMSSRENYHCVNDLTEKDLLVASVSDEENADGNQKSDMIQLSKVNKRRYTRTNQIYEKYMADKAFLLTFQSQHLEHLDDSEGSSDEDEIYYRGTESNRNTAHINGDFTENGSSIALPRNDSRNLSSYMGSIRGSNRHGSQLSHALSLNSIQHV